MSHQNKVFIAGMNTIVPQTYKCSEIADALYPETVATKPVNRLANKALAHAGITERPSVLALDEFPNKVLAKDEYHPFNWGVKSIKGLTEEIGIDEIGYMAVSYNITSHSNILPNLACQLSQGLEMDLDQMPDEIAHYGCASGLFAMEKAVEYCRKSNRAAIVFTFDQCFWIANPVYDRAHENLKAS